MTVANDSTQREAFDRANPNSLPDLLRSIAIGSLLQGQIPQVRRAVDMDDEGTSSENLATLDALDLPVGGKAHSILRATVRAGTGATGELTVVAYGTTPSTGEIGVAPNGNIVTLGTDALTDMDVVYIPERGDVIDTYFPVVSNVITLPSSVTARHVVLLEYCNAVEGTSTGRKIILVPGSGAPSAGQARLNVAKTTITFAAADAVTRARVKLLVGADEDLTTVLESAASLI